jgi:hypothetical protein
MPIQLRHTLSTFPAITNRSVYDKGLRVTKITVLLKGSGLPVPYNAPLGVRL